MGDIKSPRLIYIKGFLFLFMGLMAVLALILENPNLRDVFLLLVAIWSFARFYYFAFYVIEHYVDPGYRFAGLWAFCLYLLHRRSDPDRKPPLRDEPHE
ncbi:MAG: hypothetical protein JWN14_4781 [Chthonomonadales bacterium]|nr:hypothetical protein [Chthonomonadales bacterium]